MIDDAYGDLHRHEKEHWWFIGARAVYRTLLEIGMADVQGDLKILEVGSGSGGNFDLLGAYGSVAGLELSPLGIDLTQARPKLGLIRGSADRLPCADASFDCVALLGLIEHMEDDAQTLREAARVCKPGGAVILLTSALRILWSHHDEANRHKRRYTRGELVRLIRGARLAPIRVSYQNCFTFFPVLTLRLLQRMRSQTARFDLGGNSPLVNRLMGAVLRFEARLIRYFPLPIGVDLVAVARPERTDVH
jgi:SAM-dependent methyltransferase